MQISALILRPSPTPKFCFRRRCAPLGDPSTLRHLFHKTSSRALRSAIRFQPFSILTVDGLNDVDTDGGREDGGEGDRRGGVTSGAVDGNGGTSGHFVSGRSVPHNQPFYTLHARARPHVRPSMPRMAPVLAIRCAVRAVGTHFSGLRVERKRSGDDLC